MVIKAGSSSQATIERNCIKCTFFIKEGQACAKGILTKSPEDYYCPSWHKRASARCPSCGSNNYFSNYIGDKYTCEDCKNESVIPTDSQRLRPPVDCLKCGSIETSYDVVNQIYECGDCGWRFVDFKETVKMVNDIKQQKHYTQHAIQPVVFIGMNRIDFLAGNVIKYVSRYNMKNGVEDLRKAQHYLEMLIQREEGKEIVP